jgi:hypothetical protein
MPPYIFYDTLIPFMTFQRPQSTSKIPAHPRPPIATFTVYRRQAFWASRATGSQESWIEVAWASGIPFLGLISRETWGTLKNLTGCKQDMHTRIIHSFLGHSKFYKAPSLPRASLSLFLSGFVRPCIGYSIYISRPSEAFSRPLNLFLGALIPFTAVQSPQNTSDASYPFQGIPVQPSITSGEKV